jgi:hypothetical protein
LKPVFNALRIFPPIFVFYNHRQIARKIKRHKDILETQGISFSPGYIAVNAKGAYANARASSFYNRREGSHERSEALREQECRKVTCEDGVSQGSLRDVLLVEMPA